MAEQKIKRFNLTIKTVADALGCTERHVSALIADGEFEAIKIGSQAVRISEESYNMFIEKKKIKPEDIFDPDNEKHQSEQPPQRPTRVAQSNYLRR